MGETLRTFVQGLPKAELHLHLEGTLEPELMFELAARNGLTLPYDSVESARAAYEFSDLQSFLDLYYAGCSVLITEQDFYDLTWAYLTRAAAENIRHVEPFFDPQTHTERDVPFGTVLAGILRALEDGQQRYGITYRLIMSFLRDMSQQSASLTLERARRYGHRIAGVGLDSAELGHPPDDFAEVFTAARAAGYHVVAHAGEEGPPEYITGALDVLGAERIDHGVRCLEDQVLTARLAMDRIPLTVCPLSNVRLKVVPDMTSHPLRAMMDAGLLVTINSDDPAYFGGYLVENYIAVAEALGLSRTELIGLAAASFQAAFLDEGTRQDRIAEVEAYGSRHASS